MADRQAENRAVIKLGFRIDTTTDKIRCMQVIESTQHRCICPCSVLILGLGSRNGNAEGQENGKEGSGKQLLDVLLISIY